MYKIRQKFKKGKKRCDLTGTHPGAMIRAQA